MNFPLFLDPNTFSVSHNSSCSNKRPSFRVCLSPPGGIYLSSSLTGLHSSRLSPFFFNPKLGSPPCFPYNFRAWIICARFDQPAHCFFILYQRLTPLISSIPERWLVPSLQAELPFFPFWSASFRTSSSSVLALSALLNQSRRFFLFFFFLLEFLFGLC